MTGAGKKPRGDDERGRGRGRGVRGVSRGPRGATPSPAPAAGPSAAQGYDGPASDRGRSPSGGQSGSRRPSPARATAGGGRSKVPAGFDPETGKAYVLQKNVDLGGAAYNLYNKVSTFFSRSLSASFRWSFRLTCVSALATRTHIVRNSYCSVIPVCFRAITPVSLLNFLVMAVEACP